MARTITVPETTYAPGTYRLTVDNFQPGTTRITGRFTRVAWPGTPNDIVARVALVWSSGGGAGAEFGGGTLLNKDGTVAAFSSLSAGVPFERDPDAGPSSKRRKNVVSGEATFEVLQALTTAITIEAT